MMPANLNDAATPVGAGLLAIAVVQITQCLMYGRHRQQAGSYRTVSVFVFE